jgi:hypothetical protein
MHHIDHMALLSQNRNRLAIEDLVPGFTMCRSLANPKDTNGLLPQPVMLRLDTLYPIFQPWTPHSVTILPRASNQEWSDDHGPWQSVSRRR